jgi:hypothetical protein
MKGRLISGAFFCLFFSVSVLAQNTNRTDDQTNKADEKNSDLVITATVKAKELTIEKVPNPTVEFSGNGNRQTVWEADRENLPAEVEPNVTYRDIGIRLRIYSRFAEIHKIVVELLDETNQPTQEEQKTQTNPATNNTNQNNQITNAATKPPTQ